MQAGERRQAVGRPRLDGRRVLFEVEADGRTIACAISLAALQDLGMRRHFRPEEVLQCFEQAWLHIQAAAFRKLGSRRSSASALLNIWADDFEDTPEEEAPDRTPPAG